MKTEDLKSIVEFTQEQGMISEKELAIGMKLLPVVDKIFYVEDIGFFKLFKIFNKIKDLRKDKTISKTEKILTYFEIAMDLVEFRPGITMGKIQTELPEILEIAKFIKTQKEAEKPKEIEKINGKVTENVENPVIESLNWTLPFYTQEKFSEVGGRIFAAYGLDANNIIYTVLGLPITFKVVGYTKQALEVSIPFGEKDLWPLGEDHMLKRTLIIITFNDREIIQVADQGGHVNTAICQSYDEAKYVMAIHVKKGAILGRTLLTEVKH